MISLGIPTLRIGRVSRQDILSYKKDEFPWDPCSFHSCENRFALAYVVATNQKGTGWNALVVSGKFYDTVFRTRTPIRKEKIFDWLAVRGHETGVWQSKAMHPLDFSSPNYHEGCRPEREPPGYTYFLREDGTGLIKIGYSTSPYDRQDRIQGMCSGKLSFLGAIRADRSFETYLHRYFLLSRVRGEWFRETPELIEFIREEGTHEVVPKWVRDLQSQQKDAATP